MTGIQLNALTKRYADGTEAVKGIDLDIRDGEFMVLVGPSGCGKTTALRMIAGLEEITDGVVRIGDRVVNELPAKDRDIAMVFQSYALYPHMTVRGNIAFALKLAGVARAEAAARAEKVARLLDLGAHLDRRPASLSGGQRQRVAIGRALVRNPKAFLMDEPLSNLDAKLRLEMRLELARLQQRLGTTTVYVTHDQTEAMTLGDRVAVMRDGIVEQVGTPEALYRDPANTFVAGFIGSPPMNLLPGRLEGDRLLLPFGDVDASAIRDAGARSHPTAEVVAGIRPEAFEDGLLAPGEPGALRFRARVESIEWLGSEVYAHFLAAGEDGGAAHRVVARLDARSGAVAGVEAELVLRPEQVVLFDATGRRLGTTAAHAAR